jgi:ribosomal protein S18 acetylase RimI-like enzyme
MSVEGLTFRRFDAVQARAVADAVEDIYRHSYVDAIASGDPFDAPETFMMRFRSYTSRDDSGFAMIHALVEGQPVGQIWGWPLPPKAAFWGGLALDDATEDMEAFTAETGHRTFGLSEIMVKADYAGHGVAWALHDELFRDRPEQRAGLLVESDNTRAYERYRAWGWNRVGKLRPNWPDAPLFDVLIRDLH